MIMGKKVWAICCGAVRMEFEFYCSIAMLCEYRSKGLIDGIVISTWVGEVDNFVGLRDKLKEWNIHVVELSPIDETMSQCMDLAYMRQAFQLKAALDCIPDDVFVLRCRTDYSEDKIRAAEKVLVGEVDLSIGKYGALDTGLHYRIAVMQFSVIYKMFFLVDSGFLGYKDDISKMCCFDSMNYRYGHRHVVDMRFYTNIFQKFRLIDDCITINLLENSKLYEALQKYLQSSQRENFEFPQILNKFFALYFVLLANCFYLLTSERRIDEDDIDIADIFLGKREIGMEKHADLYCIADAELLNRVILGECKFTRAYIKLLYEIGKIALPGYAEKMRCEKKEYDELCAWIKDELQLNPSKIIQTKHYIGDGDENEFETNFESVIQFFFEKRNITTNKQILCEIMRNICDAKNYYGAVIDNISCIKKYSERLWETALPPASRTLNPEILSICAKRLFYNKENVQDVEAVKYAFNRYYRRQNFFSFPLHPYKLSAFYYYGKYMEKLGSNNFAELFYKKIREMFLVEIEEGEVKSYSDKVLLLIEKIVNINYEKYYEELSIQYMLYFLVDEALDSTLTIKAKEFLRKAIWQRKYLFLVQKEKAAIIKFGHQSNSVETREEAICLSKLLLHEKALQNEYWLQSGSDRTLEFLTEKFQLENMWFMKADRISKGSILNIEPDEIQTDDDYMLLCEILSSKKCLEENKQCLLKICGNIASRYISYWTFFMIEKDDRIRYFAVKDGREIWFNYKKFIDTQYDRGLILQKNKDGLFWPRANSITNSCFAGFIRAERDDKVMIRIELSSGTCEAKKRLLKKINYSGYENVGVIRLQQCILKFTSVEDIYSCVNKAINIFIEVGDWLTEAAWDTERYKNGYLENN